MSAPAPAGSGANRTWLISAGVGCGCLSLAAAALVIVIVIVGISRPAGPGAASQPGPAPAAQPGPAAQPAPGPVGPPGGQAGLQLQVFTVRIDQRTQSAQPADVFRPGESVGAVARFVSVPRAVTVNWMILRWEPGQTGQRGTIVTAATPVALKPEMQGQQQLFTVNTAGAAPGSYGFVFVQPGAGNQITPVASHNFQLQ